MFSELLKTAHTIEEKGKEIEVNNKIRDMLNNANKIWLGADWHLWKFRDEKITRNPNADEILTNYSKMVGPDDAYVYLGDLQHDEASEQVGLIEDLDKLTTGKKILVLGNNDIFGDDFYLEHGFNAVTNKFVYNNIIFTHAPIEKEDFQGASMNFHGHLHFSRSYCVGYYNHADIFTPAHGNKPVLLENAITKLKRGFYKPISI